MRHLGAKIIEHITSLSAETVLSGNPVCSASFKQQAIPSCTVADSCLVGRGSTLSNAGAVRVCSHDTILNDCNRKGILAHNARLNVYTTNVH